MPTFIETLMGKEDIIDTQKEVLLASNPKGARAKSKASSKRDQERVSKEELEFAFRTDSFIFNAVNVSVQMIMSAGHTIVAKKAMVRKFFENFVDNLSQVGADTTWVEICTRIYQDAYVYGAPVNELVWNEGDDKIVDLKVLDPKEIDFARSGNGNIVLDENEKPVGYVQTIPYGLEVTEDMGDPVPEDVSLSGGNKIFILAKRISYSPLYTFGSGFEGMGKVEPAYKATIWKLNLLKAGAESASRRGFSPIIAKVGNENVHPTPAMVNNVLEKLKTLDYSKYMSIPWYVTLDTLDVKTIETYADFLKYLTAMQSAALGVPVPFVTGLGEETNRATLGTQLEVFKLSLNSIAERISKGIEKNIFKPIAEAEGFDEVPQLKWNKVTISYEKEKIKTDEPKDKDDKGENDEEDKENEDKVLFTSSESARGQPLATSHQIQGVSYPKDMVKGKKVKIKSPKKKKI